MNLRGTDSAKRRPRERGVCVCVCHTRTTEIERKREGETKERERENTRAREREQRLEKRERDLYSPWFSRRRWSRGCGCSTTPWTSHSTPIGLPLSFLPLLPLLPFLLSLAHPSLSPSLPRFLPFFSPALDLLLRLCVLFTLALFSSHLFLRDYVLGFRTPVTRFPVYCRESSPFVQSVQEGHQMIGSYSPLILAFLSFPSVRVCETESKCEIQR